MTSMPGLRFTMEASFGPAARPGRVVEDNLLVSLLMDASCEQLSPLVPYVLTRNKAGRKLIVLKASSSQTTPIQLLCSPHLTLRPACNAGSMKGSSERAVKDELRSQFKEGKTFKPQDEIEARTFSDSAKLILPRRRFRNVDVERCAAAPV